jgi:hypothetical protein
MATNELIKSVDQVTSIDNQEGINYCLLIGILNRRVVTGNLF